MRMIYRLHVVEQCNKSRPDVKHGGDQKRFGLLATFLNPGDQIG